MLCKLALVTEIIYIRYMHSTFINTAFKVLDVLSLSISQLFYLFIKNLKVLVYFLIEVENSLFLFF